MWNQIFHIQTQSLLKILNFTNYFLQLMSVMTGMDVSKLQNQIQFRVFLQLKYWFATTLNVACRRAHQHHHLIGQTCLVADLGFLIYIHSFIINLFTSCFEEHLLSEDLLSKCLANFSS